MSFFGQTLLYSQEKHALPVVKAACRKHTLPVVKAVCRPPDRLCFTPRRSTPYLLFSLRTLLYLHKCKHYLLSRMSPFSMAAPRSSTFFRWPFCARTSAALRWKQHHIRTEIMYFRLTLNKILFLKKKEGGGGSRLCVTTAMKQGLKYLKWVKTGK